jgi:hypothetical protein
MTMWFLVVVLLGIIILALSFRLHSRRVHVKWYEWLIAIIGLGLLLFGLQNYWATRTEHWSSGTPLTFLLVFSLPASFLLLLVGFMVWWRQYGHGNTK